MTRYEQRNACIMMAGAVIIALLSAILLVLWSDHRLIAWLARDIQTDWTP